MVLTGRIVNGTKVVVIMEDGCEKEEVQRTYAELTVNAQEQPLHIIDWTAGDKVPVLHQSRGHAVHRCPGASQLPFPAVSSAWKAYPKGFL
jgi:hypothetical protein